MYVYTSITFESFAGSAGAETPANNLPECWLERLLAMGEGQHISNIYHILISSPADSSSFRELNIGLPQAPESIDDLSYQLRRLNSIQLVHSYGMIGLEMNRLDMCKVSMLTAVQLNMLPVNVKFNLCQNLPDVSLELIGLISRYTYDSGEPSLSAYSTNTLNYSVTTDATPWVNPGCGGEGGVMYIYIDIYI